MKVFTYIDGFNVYHSLVTFLNQNRTDTNINNSYKWCNLRRMVQLYLSECDIQESIKYFTAIPKHKGRIIVEKHKKFTNALEKYCNIEIVLGRFGNKKVYFTCRNCNAEAMDNRHEEKETDVSIGIHAVHDVLHNDINKIVIVSNDTDFIPVMRYILEKTTIKILLLIPLGAKKAAGEFTNIKKQYSERIAIKKINQDIMKNSRMSSILKVNNQEIKSPYLSFP